jgi:hypothetical protein
MVAEGRAMKRRTRLAAGLAVTALAGCGGGLDIDPRAPIVTVAPDPIRFEVIAQPAASLSPLPPPYALLSATWRTTIAETAGVGGTVERVRTTVRRKISGEPILTLTRFGASTPDAANCGPAGAACAFTPDALPAYGRLDVSQTLVAGSRFGSTERPARDLPEGLTFEVEVTYRPGEDDVHTILVRVDEGP